MCPKIIKIKVDDNVKCVGVHPLFTRLPCLPLPQSLPVVLLFCIIFSTSSLIPYRCADTLFPTTAPCFTRKSSRKRRNCVVNKRPSCWPRNSNRLLLLPPPGILKCLRMTTTMMTMIKSNRSIAHSPSVSGYVPFLRISYFQFLRLLLNSWIHPCGLLFLSLICCFFPPSLNFRSSRRCDL